jgi:phosphoribosyl 1,2-cyclic phosphodiesterase
MRYNLMLEPPRMSLELCILASGSSGNCTALRTPGGVVLIDAGIGPRSTTKRMMGSGVQLSDVRAICLTHLDHDHFSPTWFRTVVKLGIKLFCHESRRDELEVDARFAQIDVPIDTFNGQAFEPIEGLKVHAIKLAHDECGSHGFVIEGFGCRIGWATDLGQVPATLIDRFCGVDVLALESNYDPAMQEQSDRPFFLKRRIMGGKGHLSNEQAFTAIRMILDRCKSHARRLPQHIVLLHRSQECNCPQLLRRLFERDARVARRLILADQFERTGWLSVDVSRRPLVGEQLSLPI